MADMANLSNVERAWRELSEILKKIPMNRSLGHFTLTLQQTLKLAVVRRRHCLHIQQCRESSAVVLLIRGKRFCFSLISISVVGVDINLAFHSMKCPVWNRPMGGLTVEQIKKLSFTLERPLLSSSNVSATAYSSFP